MTKQQLLEEVQVLRSQLPTARPAMPPAIKANQLGLAARKHVIDTTNAAKKGAAVTGAVTKGFITGLLFGR